METKILQLIPAPPGWRAVFADRHGYVIAPIPAFALLEAVEADGTVVRWVEAVSSDEPWSGRWFEVTSFHNFAGLVLPGEPDEAAHELVEEWREREKKKSRQVS